MHAVFPFSEEAFKFDYILTRTRLTGRIRTHDPGDPNASLYQAELQPDCYYKAGTLRLEQRTTGLEPAVFPLNYIPMTEEVGVEPTANQRRTGLAIQLCHRTNHLPSGK